MQTKILRKFSKDLDKIKQPKDKKAILQIIQKVKRCSSFDEIPNSKKLKEGTWLKPSSTEALTGKAGQGNVLLQFRVISYLFFIRKFYCF